MWGNVALGPSHNRPKEVAMNYYRALISIPIQAESDDEAIRAAEERAASVHHPDGSVAGHVELIGETHGDLLEIDRVVFDDALFLRQPATRLEAVTRAAGVARK